MSTKIKSYSCNSTCFLIANGWYLITNTLIILWSWKKYYIYEMDAWYCPWIFLWGWLVNPSSTNVRVFTLGNENNKYLLVSVLLVTCAQRHLYIETHYVFLLSWETHYAVRTHCPYSYPFVDGFTPTLGENRSLFLLKKKLHGQLDLVTQ